MNQPVCFNLSLPALIGLHQRWEKGVGNEASRIKRTFKCIAISTALSDYQWNNARRTREYLQSGSTVGRVREEGPLQLAFPSTISVAMDTLVRRSRGAKKVANEAHALYEASPWSGEEEGAEKLLRQWLRSRPFRAVSAESSGAERMSPTWMVVDQQGQVVWRHEGHCMDVHLRDILLPFVMQTQVMKPLLTQQERDALMAQYRATKRRAPGEFAGTVVVKHTATTEPTK